MSTMSPIERLRAKLLQARITIDQAFGYGVAHGYAIEVLPEAVHTTLGPGTVVGVGGDGAVGFVLAADVAALAHQRASLLPAVGLGHVSVHVVDIRDLAEVA